MKLRIFSKWKLGLFWLTLVYLVAIFWNLFEMNLAVKTQNFNLLNNSALNINLILKPISVITLGNWTGLEVLRNGLDLISSSLKISPLIEKYLSQIWPESGVYAARLAVMNQLKPELLAWLTEVNKFWLGLKRSGWWRFIPLKFRQIPVEQISLDLETGLDYFLTGSKSILIVFQNSDEIRATGGFMGSYAKLDFQDGLLNEINIQDIYQPAGQFKGFVPAPPGVAEYLSSGNGLKLSDANWWPDFPESAQAVLNYFAWGKQTEVAGLFAVNLVVAEDLLRVVGPVYLKDYETIVSAENLATVARADRSDFFPGSHQKAHFLTLLFNQLQFKVSEFKLTDFFQLLQLLSRRLQTKDIQFYSPVEKIQTLAVKYGLSGQTNFQPKIWGDFKTDLIQPTSLQPLYLQLVESNVGINKANTNISRSVTAQILTNQLQLQIDFSNKNPQTNATISASKILNKPELTNGLGYVNYQRLIISPFMKLVSLTTSEGVISNWHESLVTWSGLTLKQIGFLVTVPESSQEQITFILEPDSSAPVTNLLNLPGLTLQKQAGLPVTPYELVWGSQHQNLVLETDSFIKF